MLQRKMLKLRDKVLHSIPILENRNKQLFSKRSILHSNLRYISSGIPLACACALLLLSLMMINPAISGDYSFALDTPATTTQNSEELIEEEETNVDNKLKEYADVPKTATNNIENENTILETSETETVNSEISNNVIKGDSDAEIMTLAETPTATLNVSSPSLSTNVNPGQTAYVSSNVTYSASTITDYALQITYANGYTSLKRNGGTETLAGASGKTGNNLNDNTWGFGWGTTSTDNESLTYYTMPAYGTLGSNLSTGRLEGGTTTSIDSTTKKIVFAAKFAANNTNAGHYETSALLSFTATPQKIPTLGFPTITNMQQMTTDICNSADIWNYKELNDSRDSNKYTIAKLEDGKCWMTQNLRLVNKTITSSDSDVTSNYTVPASNISSGFSNTTAGVYYGNNATNGAYYTSCAATAGSCSSATSKNDIAPSSICPKGWKLPSEQDYKDLLTAADTAKIMGSPYNFVKAGEVSYGNLEKIGEEGWYWTSTSFSNTSAYYFDLKSSTARTDAGSRSFGFSVRCVTR